VTNLAIEISRSLGCTSILLGLQLPTFQNTVALPSSVPGPPDLEIKVLWSIAASLAVTTTSRRYCPEDLQLQQHFQSSQLRKCNCLKEDCSVDLVTIYGSKPASYSIGKGDLSLAARWQGLQTDMSAPYGTENLRENGPEIAPPPPYIFYIMAFNSIREETLSPKQLSHYSDYPTYWTK
jgi:hypothetical protein